MKTIILPKKLLSVLLWTPIVVFSALLIKNSIEYYFHGYEFGILPEKAEALKDAIYPTMFYLHVGFSCLILALPLYQFWVRIRNRATRKGHQIVGKIYVYTTLLLVCPTGMYMSFYAKGDIWTKTGFFVQGVLLFWFTWQGWQTIRRGETQKHVEWMIRSYLITLSAIMFRLYHLFFAYLNLEYYDNYNASQWLSVTGNVLLAEFIISRIRKKRQTLTAERQ